LQNIPRRAAVGIHHVCSSELLSTNVSLSHISLNQSKLLPFDGFLPARLPCSTSSNPFREFLIMPCYSRNQPKLHDARLRVTTSQMLLFKFFAFDSTPCLWWLFGWESWKGSNRAKMRTIPGPGALQRVHVLQFIQNPISKITNGIMNWSWNNFRSGHLVYWRTIYKNC
jgi:hypothetical protein